jgi:hypothetical protein
MVADRLQRTACEVDLVTETYSLTRPLVLSREKSSNDQPPPLRSDTRRSVAGSRGFIT